MKPIRTILRACTAAAVLGLLAGCQATTFEHAPVAERAGCDPALVGHWFSLADADNEDNGEIEMTLDAKCTLSAIEHKKDGAVNSEPTRLHSGADDGQAYLWVDAAWAFRFADAKQPTIPGDVYVMRYRIHDDVLELQSPNDKAIAHRIIDGDLNGDIRKSDSDLINRVTGTVTPQQLRLADIFKDKPSRFSRRNRQARPSR